MLVRFGTRFSTDGAPPTALTAPTVTGSALVSGRMLTLTVTGLTGSPSPTVTPGLTVNGSSVALTPAGLNVWTFAFPSSGEVSAWAATLTASNGVAPNAAASFSGNVAPDLVTAPGAFGEDDWGLLPDDDTTPPEATAPGAFQDADWSLEL
jgi:hypothetical protein